MMNKKYIKHLNNGAFVVGYDDEKEIPKGFEEMLTNEIYNKNYLYDSVYDAEESYAEKIAPLVREKFPDVVYFVDMPQLCADSREILTIDKYDAEYGIKYSISVTALGNIVIETFGSHDCEPQYLQDIRLTKEESLRIAKALTGSEIVDICECNDLPELDR